MRALTLAIAAIASIVLPAQAQQDYPNRIVNIVNPTQAGATTDILARALVVGLTSRLGQQFLVVNRPGASGAIGTASVARAAPDGYTLLFGAVYVLSVLPAALKADIGYDSRSLVPVCQTVSNAMVMAVRPDSPFKTLADLVRRRARSRASSTTATRAPARSPISRWRSFSTPPSSTSRAFPAAAIRRW